MPEMPKLPKLPKMGDSLADREGVKFTRLTGARMTTLHEYVTESTKTELSSKKPAERRQHRRHDLETQTIAVERWSGRNGSKIQFGRLVDLSSGGMRVRTNRADVHPDQQIRVRLALPAYAGISPFVDTSSGTMTPRNEWVGWMAVSRVEPANEGEYEVAGRLVDMEELDRGMLGLYLSTQPMAA
jgi:hypothetical protein